jgi:hypothetical protein
MSKLCKVLLFLFMMYSIVSSQSTGDTSKTSFGKKNEEKQLNNKHKEQESFQQNRLEIQNNILKVPLNLKIYQKVLQLELNEGRQLSEEDLITGMTGIELDAFDYNKKLTQKMIADVYGEDLINERKILSALGITEDQIKIIAAILKYFVFAAHL